MVLPSQDADQLIAHLGRHERLVVAFSGGVDSSVVAAAAVRAATTEAIAVTADSPSVPRWQLEWAKRIAGEIGIEHQTIATEEGQRPEYIRNDSQRCFYCKETLYDRLCAISDRFEATIVSGTNADDTGDHRPGIAAGRAAGVETPLADLGITKPRVRALARHFGLTNAELPASPCLASRVAYGVEVTPERLGRIERAEQWLRQRGFRDVRVRVHADELARVEVPRDQLPELLHSEWSDAFPEVFREFGFRYVTVDFQGLRSGNLNHALVPLVTISPSPINGSESSGSGSA